MLSSASGVRILINKYAIDGSKGESVMRRVRTRWNALSLARKSTVVFTLLSALILVSSRLLPVARFLASERMDHRCDSHGDCVRFIVLSRPPILVITSLGEAKRMGRTLKTASAQAKR
ncbi:MAG: hypothetical protein C7B47_18170 [Sulfobacillus thermosulfidooxidans]|uniref:Uncharacterized protein n=1 Tax=Sulfobacillus thermosulfidooxidans TaxID=28034 RepID=A0A2T2WDF7_SULTH|nr:MAG: hypothetical protein C7B47_18170 [Sulfobacillus thermosulfidooxidans]